MNTINSLTGHALNLGLLSTLFFVIGMIKPKWALFFMEKPTRWYIANIYLLLVMVFMTMWGNGIQQEKMAKKRKEPVVQSAVPVPVPEAVPVPTPAAPKKK